MFICKRFCSFITASDIIQTSFSICVTYKLQSMNYFAFSVKDRFLFFWLTAQAFKNTPPLIRRYDIY